MLPTLLVTGEEEEEEEEQSGVTATDRTHPSLMRNAAALSSLGRSHFLLSISSIFSGSSPMTRQRGQIRARSSMRERGKEIQQEKKKKFLKEEGEQASEVKRGRWRERTQRRGRKLGEGGAGILPSTASAPAGCLGRPLRTGRQRSIFATSLGGRKRARRVSAVNHGHKGANGGQL